MRVIKSKEPDWWFQWQKLDLKKGALVQGLCLQKDASRHLQLTLLLNLGTGGQIWFSQRIQGCRILSGPFWFLNICYYLTIKYEHMLKKNIAWNKQNTSQLVFVLYGANLSFSSEVMLKAWRWHETISLCSSLLRMTVSPGTKGNRRRTSDPRKVGWLGTLE